MEAGEPQGLQVIGKLETQEIWWCVSHPKVRSFKTQESCFRSSQEVGKIQHLIQKMIRQKIFSLIQFLFFYSGFQLV